MPPRDESPNRPVSRRAALRTGGAALAGMAALSALPAEGAAAEAPPVPGMLAGQVALVTGAARGIGRAIALGLAGAGADVALLDIARDIPGHRVPLARPEDLDEAARLVRGLGRRALTLQADVRDLPALQRAVQRVETELGPLAIAVANAGIHAPAPLVQTSETADQDWRNVLEVNVLGTANTLRAVLPVMAPRGQGRVVAVSSTFGRQGNGGNANYVASKWAVIGLVKAAAIEAGPSGITVNAVAPTAVRTLLGGPQSDEQRRTGDAWLRANYHFLPVGILEPEDVAGAVVYLASPGARYVTGATIDVAAGANARYTG